MTKYRDQFNKYIKSDKEKKAQAFAIRAHLKTKYGKLPYEYHLKAVRDEIPDDASEEVKCAAWLHDTVEDTDVTLSEIRELFGGKVARLVDSCTDEPGPNRKERKKKTNNKLRLAVADAKMVKLADRIANMRASMENPDKAKMYRDEFPDFIRVTCGDSQNRDLIIKAFILYLDSLEQVKS